jgi:hypothetical protein
VRAALFICAGRYTCGAPVRFALQGTNDRVAAPWRTTVPMAPKSVAIHGASTFTYGCCIVRREPHGRKWTKCVTKVT